VVLVGTTKKILIDFEKLKIGFKRVKDDLNEIEIKNQYDVASMLFMGEKDIENMISGAELHTDNNPILEFSNINEYYRENKYTNLRAMLGYKKENLLSYFSISNEERSILKNYFIATFNSLASQFAAQAGEHEKAKSLEKKAKELRTIRNQSPK
jgi:hypothetical protein